MRSGLRVTLSQSKDTKSASARRSRRFLSPVLSRMPYITGIQSLRPHRLLGLRQMTELNRIMVPGIHRQVQLNRLMRIHRQVQLNRLLIIRRRLLVIIPGGGNALVVVDISTGRLEARSFSDNIRRGEIQRMLAVTHAQLKHRRSSSHLDLLSRGRGERSL